LGWHCGPGSRQPERSRRTWRTGQPARGRGLPATERRGHRCRDCLSRPARLNPAQALPHYPPEVAKRNRARPARCYWRPIFPFRYRTATTGNAENRARPARSDRKPQAAPADGRTHARFAQVDPDAGKQFERSAEAQKAHALMIRPDRGESKRTAFRQFRRQC
jgi:hypothetical protein